MWGAYTDTATSHSSYFHILKAVTEGRGAAMLLMLCIENVPLKPEQGYRLEGEKTEKMDSSENPHPSWFPVLFHLCAWQDNFSVMFKIVF